MKKWKRTVKIINLQISNLACLNSSYNIRTVFRDHLRYRELSASEKGD